MEDQSHDLTGTLAIFVLPAFDGSEERVAITRPAVTVGQAPGNDVVLDDDTVSSRHARLEFEMGGWKLIDLGSTNGTFVDGVRLTADIPTPIVDAARIRFGGLDTTFHLTEGADPDQVELPEIEEPVSIRNRKGFRVPVWLVVLIVVLIAVLVALIVVYGGGDAPDPLAWAEWIAIEEPLRAA